MLRNVSKNGFLLYAVGNLLMPLLVSVVTLFCARTGWQKPWGPVHTAHGVAPDTAAEDHKTGGSSREEPGCGRDSAASCSGPRLWSSCTARFGTTICVFYRPEGLRHSRALVFPYFKSVMQSGTFVLKSAFRITMIMFFSQINKMLTLQYCFSFYSQGYPLLWNLPVLPRASKELPLLVGCFSFLWDGRLNKAFLAGWSFVYKTKLQLCWVIEECVESSRHPPSIINVFAFTFFFNSLIF